MRQLIKKILKEYVNEGFVRSDAPTEERYKHVADEVIHFMEKQNISSIPDYSTLANWKPDTDSDFRPNMKYLLQKYLRKGEYLQNVVPLIKSVRPDFTTSIQRGKHRVDEFVVVFSNGEKIVYNTFKMNGIQLVPQPKNFEFQYVMDGKLRTKKPDFYWAQRKAIIEVAGLEDTTFNKDYIKKMMAAKNQMEKEGKTIIILDYYSYRKNLQGFYKYVCETFGFPYDPMDFWKANMVKDLPIEDLKREVAELIKKGTGKTYGERWRQNKIITQLLTKDSKDLSKPEGYKSASEFKRETGIGLRLSDENFRKNLQKAWCLSSGSNEATKDKFKELFVDQKLSKNTVADAKTKYPEYFNPEKKDEICKDYSS